MLNGMLLVVIYTMRWVFKHRESIHVSHCKQESQENVKLRLDKKINKTAMETFSNLTITESSCFRSCIFSSLILSVLRLCLWINDWFAWMSMTALSRTYYIAMTMNNNQI